MAKGGRGRSRTSSRQFRGMPYPSFRFTHDDDNHNNLIETKTISSLENNDNNIDNKKENWEDVTCSVCMEYPHSAVLLLCSSHDKGCRPFMCGTSYRHSNCLDQYKKAYTKLAGDLAELACPLCRGQVKGWTVIEPAREYLNSKERSCVHEGCAFVGDYGELRRHARSDHCGSRRPRDVDPALEQKWRRLEREQERSDVISTITSAMPGAMFFGDYVIEGNTNNNNINNSNNGVYDDDSDDSDAGVGVGIGEGFDSNLVNVFLLLHAFGPSSTNGNVTPVAANGNVTPVGGVGSEHDEDGDIGGDMSLASRLRRHGRVLMGRSGRRRRRRDGNGGGGGGGGGGGDGNGDGTGL